MLREATGLEALSRKPPMGPTAPRTLAVESFRTSEEVGWALHLLLTLSVRFNMALCTKPPMPLVGDAGRSEVRRVWAVDMVRPSTGASPSAVGGRSEVGNGNFCESSEGRGDLASDLRSSDIEAMLVGRLFQVVLPRTEVILDVGLGSAGSGGGLEPPALLSDTESVSFAIPGRECFTVPVFSWTAPSLLERYAGE